MRTSSIRNGPSQNGSSPGATSRRSASRSRPCSSSFDLTRPSVSRVATTTGTLTSRMRYGSEPTWSSCPCVSTTPRIMCSRSRRYVNSGRTRSTPRCSSRGKARPASTTTIESSASYAVMFLPTSPRPPSGMILQEPIRIRSLGRGGAQHAGTLEACANLLRLALGRLDHRQPKTAQLVAEEVQRGLDRNRVGDDPQELEPGGHLLVQARRGLEVAVLVAPNHLLGLHAPYVRMHTDPADGAELEEREDQVVVAGVEIEAEARDLPRLFEVVVRLLHGSNVLDPSQLLDRCRLDVDDDAARDVVDDDRLVGARRDLLEVPHDGALRRLGVVRRHDEEAVDAEGVSALRELCRVP